VFCRGRIWPWQRRGWREDDDGRYWWHASCWQHWDDWAKHSWQDDWSKT
jgi:hypothetical protein